MRNAAGLVAVATIGCLLTGSKRGLRTGLRFLTLFAAALLAAPSAGAANLDCNVHLDRDAAPGLQSYREMCRTMPGVTATDDWPICVCNNTGAIRNVRTDSVCPSGYTAVGRCKPARDHYRTCDNCQDTPSPHCVGNSCESGCGTQGAYCYANPTLHAFVPDDRLCDAAAHETLSAVEGCKALCRKYFANRYFDHTDQRQSTNGSWRLGTHATIPTLGDVPGQLTEICEATCGPPNWNDPTAPYGADHSCHWQFVSFIRWNPNESQDGWLRSFAVNRDKADAPSGKCNDLIAYYCNLPSVIPDNASNKLAKRGQCKKNLVLWKPILGPSYADPVDFLKLTKFDLSEDIQNPTAADVADDAICDHFYRGNYLAAYTCYKRGDGAENAEHFCGDATCGSPGTLGGDCTECSSDARCPTGTAPAAFGPAQITVPAKVAACQGTGDPLPSPLALTATYAGQEALPQADQVVEALWMNLTSGASGRLTFAGANSSQSTWTAAVPLQAGLNNVMVRFTDRALRISGDAVEVVRQ
jgi:hypothetical protein